MCLYFSFTTATGRKYLPTPGLKVPSRPETEAVESSEDVRVEEPLSGEVSPAAPPATSEIQNEETQPSGEYYKILITGSSSIIS